MSDDLERRLREVPADFPTPDAAEMARVEQRVQALLPRITRRSRAAPTVGVVVAALAVGALGGSWATLAWGTSARPVDHDLTIAVRQYTQGLSRYVALSGHVPVRRSGEVVEILERDCGGQFDRIVSGTQSGPGGLWLKEDIFAGGAVSFVARWNGRYSERVLIRWPLRPWVERVGRRRAWKVILYTELQNMRGRAVVLQRSTRLGGWVRVRQERLRLVERQGGSMGYSAVFTVRQRGLTLRVVVPEASARPCYDAGVSKTWRS